MSPSPPSTSRSAQLGIMMMLGSAATFGLQDGFSRLLAETYSVLSIVAIRYWFFMLFVLAFSATHPSGIRGVARTSRPVLQIFRGLLLVSQICTAIYGFTIVGLVGWQVIFASYPLMIAALSVPFLGERVGWRRWFAIAIGFVGVAIALDPQAAFFSPQIILPVLGAIQFALYGILTRIAGRMDSAATSFFWTGVAGAVATTMIAPFAWDPPTGSDWGWMAALCVTGVVGHFLLIKALEQAEASLLQPFAYFSMLVSATIGHFAFGDPVTPAMLFGAAIIVAAGLFTLARERRQSQLSRP